MKVLCAVDGSKYSQRGVEALGVLLHRSLRELILVHVIDTGLLELGLKQEGTTSREIKKVLATLEQEGKDILKFSHTHATRVLNTKSTKPIVKIRSVLAKGHAAEALVKEAEKRKPHVIVLGSRGFHDIKGYMMGSVSRKVLSHAPCPVLIVKEPIQSPVRVVLAVDGSSASKRAVNFLKSWIPPAAVSVHVLSVIPQVLKRLGRGFRGKPYAKSLGDAFQKQAQGSVAEVRALLLSKKFTVSTQVVSGPPRTSILDCLVKREANLAILGAKGLTGLERFQMGSVSEWVAAYSGCSVLVTRPQPGQR